MVHTDIDAGTKGKVTDAVTDGSSASRRWVRWMGGIGALLALLLGGCATQQVERLASNPDETVFQLQGNRVAALEAQARRLCPYGHEVLGESRRGQTLQLDPGALGHPIGWLTEQFDARPIRARLLIRCKAAPAIAAVPVPSS